MINLTEEDIANLALMISPYNNPAKIAFNLKELPEEFSKLMIDYLSIFNSKEEARDFLAPNNNFSLNRAIYRTLLLSKSFSAWYNRQTVGIKIGWIFEIAKEHNQEVELLSGIIAKENSGHKLNSLYKELLIDWLIKNHSLPENLISLFLKGYFTGEEKTKIMDELIKREEYSKLEIFWKSRAVAVQSKLISRAPLEKLPFLLGTKNKQLLSIIERRMQETKKV